MTEPYPKAFSRRLLLPACFRVNARAAIRTGDRRGRLADEKKKEFARNDPSPDPGPGARAARARSPRERRDGPARAAPWPWTPRRPAQRGDAGPPRGHAKAARRGPEGRPAPAPRP